MDKKKPIQTHPNQIHPPPNTIPTHKHNNIQTREANSILPEGIKMNILYIAEDISLPDHHGGSTHAQETIDNLPNHFDKVVVLCKQKNGQPTKEIIDDITYYRSKPTKSKISKNLFSLVKMKETVRTIIQTEDIDCVWQRNRIFGGQGIIVGKEMGKKTLLEMNEPIECSKDHPAYPLIAKWFHHLTPYADKVTGTHKNMFNRINKAKRIHIHYGTNPEKFNIAKSSYEVKRQLGLTDPVLFYSGSFQRWHSIEPALHAFNDITRVFPKAKFLLVGDGQQKKYLEKVVQMLRIKGVRFLGEIPYESMCEYINASDVCLALFDRNNKTIKDLDYFYSPIKVHEYKACGKPIVASNIGNLNELVRNGINGYVVDEQKTNEIRDAVLRLFEDQGLCKTIGENNIREVEEKYRWDYVTKQVVEKWLG